MQLTSSIVIFNKPNAAQNTTTTPYNTTTTSHIIANCQQTNLKPNHSSTNTAKNDTKHPTFHNNYEQISNTLISKVHTLNIRKAGGKKWTKKSTKKTTQKETLYIPHV